MYLKKTGNKEFPKYKKLKNIISMKNARIDKKNFFLLEPEPEKKIQNGSGSKGPKKPGSGRLRHQLRLRNTAL